MDILDNEKIYLMIKDYPVNDVIASLQAAINKRIDELVDMNAGHSDAAKELSLASHHLDLFLRS